MNCSTCVLLPYGNYYYKKIVPIYDKNAVITGLDALNYFISNQSIYRKVIEMSNNSGKYNKMNKRYYAKFNGVMMDANDILLAKKQINTYEKYREYIKIKLYEERYSKGIKKRVVNNCNSENNQLLRYRRLLGEDVKFCNTGCIVNYEDYGYNNICDDKLDKHFERYKNYNKSLDDCMKCNPSIYLSEKYFQQRKSTYEKFYQTYFEACFYISHIKNKINYIKNSSLKAKTSNFFLNINKDLFNFNNYTDKSKNVYSSKDVITIYNSLIS